MVFRFFLTKPRFRLRFHKRLLPLFSGMVRGVNSAWDAQHLSILTTSGVPLERQCVLLVRSNDFLRQELRSPEKSVKAAHYHRSLDQTGYFRR